MGIKTALKPSRAYNLSLIDTTRLRIFSTIELLQGCQGVTLKFTKISKAVKHCMNIVTVGTIKKASESEG